MEDAPQDTNRELVRMWRVFRTTKQMLKDRGYELLDEEIEIPLDEFRQKYADGHGNPDRARMDFTLRPSLDMINKYTKTDRNGVKKDPEIGLIRVKYNGDDSVGLKQVRAFAQDIDSMDNGFYSGIFITTVPVSPACHKVGPTVAPKTFEIFQESDLLVNITHHELVPKHVLLSPEEKSALLQRYRLKPNQLPRIMKEDPVARYLGLRRGDVVKIIRKSTTAGRYASYRTCV